MRGALTSLSDHPRDDPRDDPRDEARSGAGDGICCGLGAEVNVGHVAAAAVDRAGRICGEFRRELDIRALQPVEAIDHLAEVIGTLLEALDAQGITAMGLTVAVPGLVGPGSDRVTLAPDLAWREFELADALTTALVAQGCPRLPVAVDNEADLAALAELDRVRRAEPGDGHADNQDDGDDMLVVYGVAGVGGGLIADGRLVRGHRGWAGEIGHMTVDPQGRPCACGRVGCWETTIGLQALLAAAADPDDPVRDPALILDELLAALVSRAALGDTRTLAALERVGSWIATGIAPLVSALDPGRVVLGGYFAALGEWLAPVVRRELDAVLLAPQRGGTRVVASGLGLGAALRGGALAALDPVLTTARGAHHGAAPNGGAR